MTVSNHPYKRRPHSSLPPQSKIKLSHSTWTLVNSSKLRSVSTTFELCAYACPRTTIKFKAKNLTPALDTWWRSLTQSWMTVLYRNRSKRGKLFLLRESLSSCWSSRQGSTVSRLTRTSGKFGTKSSCSTTPWLTKPLARYAKRNRAANFWISRRRSNGCRWC